MAGIDFGPVEAAIRHAASGSAPAATVVPALLKSLVQTTRAVNNFPTDEQGNVALFSSNKSFDQESSEYAKAVLGLLSSLIDQVRGKHPNASETPHNGLRACRSSQERAQQSQLLWQQIQLIHHPLMVFGISWKWFSNPLTCGWTR